MQTEILQIRESEDKGADGISSLVSLGLTVTTSLIDIPHISSKLTASFKHLLNDKAILIMLLANLAQQIKYSIPCSNQKLCFQAWIHWHICHT